MSAADRWPAQIKFIVGNEACERFSFYGMKSILAGYIAGEVARGGLGQDVDTATSIMLLSERGKLALTDLVAEYLPAFAQNGKEKITLEDLLLHISGLTPGNDW